MGGADGATGVRGGGDVKRTGAAPIDDDVEGAEMRCQILALMLRTDSRPT